MPFGTNNINYMINKSNNENVKINNNNSNKLIHSQTIQNYFNENIDKNLSQTSTQNGIN